MVNIVCWLIGPVHDVSWVIQICWTLFLGWYGPVRDVSWVIQICWTLFLGWYGPVRDFSSVILQICWTLFLGWYGPVRDVSWVIQICWTLFIGLYGLVYDVSGFGYTAVFRWLERCTNRHDFWFWCCGSWELPALTAGWPSDDGKGVDGGDYYPVEILPQHLPGTTEGYGRTN
jgi:hypothetical protein